MSAYRVQWCDGQLVGMTEEYLTEERAEQRATELVKSGVRYVCVYGVDGRAA